MIDCGETTTLDTERLTTGAVNTLKALTPRLSDLNNLLLNPPKVNETFQIAFEVIFDENVKVL